MYAGECMWTRSSVTQTHMHCTACSPRAESSDELKTRDEMMFQVDSVQQQMRAAPVDADSRFDRKHKLECMSYMFIVCPLHANYMSIGSTTAITTTTSSSTTTITTTTTANSFSLPKSSLLLYGRALSHSVLVLLLLLLPHNGGDNSK